MEKLLFFINKLKLIKIKSYPSFASHVHTRTTNPVWKKRQIRDVIRKLNTIGNDKTLSFRFKSLTQEAKTGEEDEPYVFSNDFLSVVWEVKVNKISKKTHGCVKEQEDWILVMRNNQILKICVFGLWDDVFGVRGCGSTYRVMQGTERYTEMVTWGYSVL